MEPESLPVMKATGCLGQKHSLVWTANGTQASLCVRVRILRCYGIPSYIHEDKFARSKMILAVSKC